MKNLVRLLMADRDDEYSRVLSEALTVYDKKMMITRMSPDELFSEGKYNDIKDRFDVIMCSRYPSGEALRDRSLRDKMIVISENIVTRSISSVFEENEEYSSGKIKTIPRYTPVDRLSSEIRMFIGERGGWSPGEAEAERTDITAVGSPVGGAGTTSSSYGLSSIISEKTRGRVLLLSLEEFPSTPAFSRPGGEDFYKYDITAYLYYLFENRAPSSFLEQFLVSCGDGVYAFKQSPGRNQILTLTHDEFRTFFASVNDASLFSHIVVDLGSSLNENSLFILENADSIILVRRGDGPEGEMRYREWKKEISLRLDRSVSAKVTEVYNMTKKAGHHKIRYDDSSFIYYDDGRQETDQSGMFMSDIVKLYDELSGVI